MYIHPGEPSEFSGEKSPLIQLQQAINQVNPMNCSEPIHRLTGFQNRPGPWLTSASGSNVSRSVPPKEEGSVPFRRGVEVSPVENGGGLLQLQGMTF